MPAFDRHQIHLDTADRHGPPVPIECRPVRLPGCTVETLSIGSYQFFGDATHLRRIRDVIEVRLAAIESDALAVEAWTRQRAAETDTGMDAGFPPVEGATTEVDLDLAVMATG